ncbi:MAG: PilN domain-containing protein [Candidatus Omnitrophica bacterium]|nr:PilN domain-containing protein [Candidatus Omnitrophota bacterium]
MILINLLPEEFVEKKVVLPLPLKEIGIGLNVLLLVIWGLAGLREGGVRKELGRVETELSGMAADLAAAEQVAKQLNENLLPKKNFLDSLKKPESQWDRVMNLISDALPDGMWLSSLTLSESPQVTVRLEGMAKSLKDRSSVSMIGDFVAGLKGKLEELSSVHFGQETFTQEKELELERITQFVVEFQKKGTANA